MGSVCAVLVCITHALLFVVIVILGVGMDEIVKVWFMTFLILDFHAYFFLDISCSWLAGVDYFVRLVFLCFDFVWCAPKNFLNYVSRVIMFGSVTLV